MATKDLHHCAQLLSKMLEKDTGSISGQGGVKNKHASTHSAKTFITTGRIPRKVLMSKAVKSKGSTRAPMKPRAVSAIRQSKSYTNEETEAEQTNFKSTPHFQTDPKSKARSLSSGQRTIRVPTADMEPAFRPEYTRISPPAPVLFNHRLACSTPNEASKKLVDVGGALILNGSTKTQVLNSTDEVRAFHPPPAKSPMPKLVHADVNFVSNPYCFNISENRADTGALKDFATTSRQNFIDGSERKLLSESSNGKYQGLLESHIEQIKQSIDFPTKSIGVGNSLNHANVGKSMHSVGVGNSLNHADLGKSMHSVGVGNSVHSIGVGHSFHSPANVENFVRNSMLRKSFNLPEKPPRYSSQSEKTVDHPEADMTSDHLIRNRRSGSMTDLSSVQKLNSLQDPSGSPVHHTQLGSFLRQGSEKIARYGPLTVGSSGNLFGSCDFNACGDSGTEGRGGGSSRLDFSSVRTESSDSVRLVALLQQVKNVVSEKQNCKISRLISEIQDVVSNSPSKSRMSPADIETDLALQPLRSENAQLRRRVRILNQQMRDKEKLLEAAEKPDSSFQVLHLSMLNQHLETQLGQLKEEIDDLHRRNRSLQEDYSQVVQEKKDLLEVTAKKDNNHLKSLQDKMREMNQAKEEFDRLLKEKQKEIEKFKEKITHLQFGLMQKDKETENAENLIRSLQESITRLVHDLQSSTLHSKTVNTFSETLKQIKYLTDTNFKIEDPPIKFFEASSSNPELRASERTLTSGNSLDPSITTVKEIPELSSAKPNTSTLSNNSLKSSFSSRHITTPNIESSTERRINEGTDQTEGTSRTQWPTSGITVKDLLKPLPNLVQYNTEHAKSGKHNNWPDQFDRAENSENEETTLVEFDDEAQVKFRTVQSLTDISHHSITDYFQKYQTGELHGAVNNLQKLTRTPSLCSANSNTLSLSSRSLSENSESPVDDEGFSIHMSDFKNFGDRQHNSEVDTDVSDFEPKRIQPESNSEIKDTPGLHLDLRSLHVGETDSVGTASTLSSLRTISFVDEQAFKDSLASLDANITQIQENLRRSLTLKFSKLAD